MNSLNNYEDLIIEEVFEHIAHEKMSLDDFKEWYYDRIINAFIHGQENMLEAGYVPMV